MCIYGYLYAGCIGCIYLPAYLCVSTYVLAYSEEDVEVEVASDDDAIREVR